MTKVEPKYKPKPHENADIRNRFISYQLKDDQPARYTEIRRRGKALAVYMQRNCPPTRERSLALTKLEECVMWANASIARNE